MKNSKFYYVGLLLVTIVLALMAHFFDLKKYD